MVFSGISFQRVKLIKKTDKRKTYQIEKKKVQHDTFPSLIAFATLSLDGLVVSC
jgi:hypothetical protein